MAFFNRSALEASLASKVLSKVSLTLAAFSLRLSRTDFALRSACSVNFRIDILFCQAKGVVHYGNLLSRHAKHFGESSGIANSFVDLLGRLKACDGWTESGRARGLPNLCQIC
jgi:hypothetical protein